MLGRGALAEPRYRGVLFDLFGTLTPCYPLEGVRRVIREMAEDLAIEPDAFEAAWAATFDGRQRGAFHSVEHNLNAVLSVLGERRNDACVKAAATRRLQFEVAAMRPRRGVLAALAVLRTMRTRLALVSNCSLETPTMWPTLSLRRAIDAAVFSCVVGSAKPDANIYLYAARSLGVAPSDCLFVGDGSADELAGARACGMDAALIRGPDDDDTFPGRIERAQWDGPIISSIKEVIVLAAR